MFLGAGSVIGSVAGGKFADHFFLKYGRGGRLIVSYISACALGFALVGYGILITRHLYAALMFAFFVGLFVTSTRPGMMAFAAAEFPHEAGGAIGMCV